MLWFYALFFLFGLLVGSFVNGITYRLVERHAVLTVRSKCGSCSTNIHPWDLVPVLSYLLLGGRCRACGAKIPAEFPWVEAATGFIYCALAWRIGLRWELLVWLIFVTLLLINTLTDLKTRLVHNSVLYPLPVLGGILAVLSGVWMERALFAVLLTASILLLARFLSRRLGREAMGNGDGYIIVALALTLRPEAVSWMLVVAGVLGIVWAVLRRERELPFVPMLCAGWLVILLGGIPS